MVYDFLADTLMSNVINARDFLGVLAFDKWIGNADARQRVFFRIRAQHAISVAEFTPEPGGSLT